MTFFPGQGTRQLGALKGADDYTRSVLLTELLADHLPQLPWYLRKLQCLLEDSSTVLGNVCAALETHPAVCAHFVRIGSLAEPVQPIVVPVDQLVVMMGKRRVWTTAVAAFLLNEMTGPWSTVARQHIAAIALVRANRALIRARALEDEAPEQAYVSGVLSVIGLLPLLDAGRTTDQAPEWLAISAEAVRKQQEMFGTDFLELGRWITMLWRLPLDMANTEVTSDARPALSNSLVLPKNSYSRGMAPKPEPGTRNLVLVPRGCE